MFLEVGGQRTADGGRHELINALQQSWRREMEGALTYRQLAGRETDERRQHIMLALAETEERHAGRWAERLRELGGAVPDLKEIKPKFGWAMQAASTDVIIRKLEAQEEKDTAAYEHILSVSQTDEPSREILKEVIEDEKEHARTLHVMAGPANPRSALDLILRREKWHVTGGSWIGDAIYGVNDGLGAVFGIVSGMAGYTGGSHYVLVAGLAGMLASALSMGSGAYLAAKSEREIYEAELSRERREIEEHPEEEQEELELFYQLKGFTAEEAALLVNRLQQQPDALLKTLAHEELGLSEAAFPNPWTALFSATLSTAVGAFIPIVPFFFTEGMPAVVASAVISVVAHFAVGAAKTLVTTRSWWASGTEMTVVGIIEAAVTYGLGVLFGAVG